MWSIRWFSASILFLLGAQKLGDAQNVGPEESGLPYPVGQISYRTGGSIVSIKPACLPPWIQRDIVITIKGWDGFDDDDDDDDGDGGVHIQKIAACYFLHEQAFEHVDIRSSNLMAHFLDIAGLKTILKSQYNSVARQVPGKQKEWACRAPPMTAGYWVPILVFKSDRKRVQRNSAVWGRADNTQDEDKTVIELTVLETSWKNRLNRSGPNSRQPGLLLADQPTPVALEGTGLAAPGSCRLSNKKRHHSAIVMNSSLAICEVVGSEGDAFLRFAWAKDCEIDMDVQLYHPPRIIGLHPPAITRWGNTTVKLTMQPYTNKHSNKPFTPKNSMLVPSLIIPHARSDWGDLIIRGAMDLSDPRQWVGSFQVNEPEPLQSGNFAVKFALNGRDYMQAHLAMQVHGPFVSLTSPLQAVEESGTSRIGVELSTPISMPATVSLKLGIPENASNRIRLLEGKVEWLPGEAGEKFFEISAAENATENLGRFRVNASLSGAVHADVAQHASKAEIAILKNGELPVFGIKKTQQVRYPGDGDTYAIVELLKGADDIGSVLNYTVNLQHNTNKNNATGCTVEGDFIDNMSGTIAWEKNMTEYVIHIPILWGNIPFSAQIFLEVELHAWQAGRVERKKRVVAHIYGVSKDTCPPGTNRAWNVTTEELINSSSSAEFNEGAQDAGVTTMYVKGASEGAPEHEVELVPYFSPNHDNYTAMVPFGMEIVDLVIHNDQSRKLEVIDSERCAMHGQPEEFMIKSGVVKTRITMRDRDLCNIVVRSEDVFLNEANELLLTESSPPESSPDSDDNEDGSGLGREYNVQFIQLSNPGHAVLDAVAVRNGTHVVTICGPVGDSVSMTSMKTTLERMEDASNFEVVEGYPKTECRVNGPNYLDAMLRGSALWVIPILMFPDVQTTKVEVSGVFLQGFGALRQNSTLLATVIHNIPSDAADVSLSFDIRVTAADTVTTNLYKFVLGNPSSTVKVFAAGSEFDPREPESGQVEERAPADEIDAGESGWPRPPAENSWCTPCPKGMYSSIVDAPHCSPCPPGHYACARGNCECLKCAPGTFTYNWASEKCRPCMIGTFAPERGSQYCSLCGEGWTSHKEGQALCEVRIRPTDLSKHYAIIASFGMLLNGTSLEEVDQLQPGVNASGMAVLKILIRRDMSEAFNISMADVEVTDVSPVGRRALLVNVTTTFKVPMPDNATEEEREAAMRNAELAGDDAIWQIATNPDRALQLTTTATNAHAEVNPEEAKFHKSRPSDLQSNFFVRYGMIIWPVFSVVVIIGVGCCVWWCRLRRKDRMRLLMRMMGANSWYGLRIPSDTTMGADLDEEPPGFTLVARHRNPIHTANGET